ncbi:MAG: hypothetical protein HY843_00850, partial [Bdellovibrio sp.]|nr:hypothetical protein [Bdellovibrio sp.]
SVKEQGKVKIIGVRFEGGEPMFLVGNLQKPEKIALKDIVKIEATTDDDPKNIQNQLKTPQTETATETATDTATETETGPAPQPNVFTFKRGEGSKNIDKISPEQKQAIENFAKIQKQAHLMKTEDRGGFPNGLKDYEQEGGHKQ